MALAKRLSKRAHGARAISRTGRTIDHALQQLMLNLREKAQKDGN
jgi:hypothetical protein